MQRAVRQTARAGAAAAGRQARHSAHKAKQLPDQGNSAAMAFFFGALMGGLGQQLYSTSSNKNYRKEYEREHALVKELEKKLEELATSAAAAANSQGELMQLSNDYMQCTKGSEELTGDLEHMATRMRATQEELRQSRKRIDQLTVENDQYLSSITDKIEQKAHSTKVATVGFVTADGELVSVRKGAPGHLSVSLGASAPADVSKLQYDDATGSLKVNEKSVLIPEGRRDIVAMQLSTLADGNGVEHNVVPRMVEFVDAEGDRVRFEASDGRLVVNVKGTGVAPTRPLTYDPAARTLDCGGAGVCVLPAHEAEALMRRIRRLADKVKAEHKL